MVSKITNKVSAARELIVLWEEGFFRELRSLKEIENILLSKGICFNKSNLCNALQSLKKELIRRGTKGTFRYIQRRNAVDKTVQKIENELFDEILKKKLSKNFKTEIIDLELNFGKSGNCTAFLLRKVLEKLIYIIFSKNGISKKIENPTKPGHLVGLEAMINISAAERINGLPILMPQTAQEIKGAKFLGDISAHDPLTDVDMKTIILQMPYIVTAFKELISHF